MTIEYVKLSPTMNDTVLVTTPVPRALQAALAARLLADPAVGGEQVGYVESARDIRADARLQMMGGEFCGNATMALGALLAGDEDVELLLEVSGADGFVPCRIRRESDGWLGAVDMPLPTAIAEAELATDGGALVAPLVRMPGIAHLILPAEAGITDAELRRRMPDWCRRLRAEALGALTWDAEASAIDPIVYVPSAGTLVREHGCGSGSAAVGAWLADRAGHSLATDVRQPGGTIAVSAEVRRGAIVRLTIAGRVRLLSAGEYKWER